MYALVHHITTETTHLYIILTHAVLIDLKTICEKEPNDYTLNLGCYRAVFRAELEKQSSPTMRVSGAESAETS